MNCYLVDYENVGADYIRTFIDTYEAHTEDDDDYDDYYGNDKLIIFYSEQCPSIPLDLVENFINKKLDVRCKQSTVGTKNALDFQLSSYLGFMIGSNSSADKYIIISNDKGYDCICDFWKSNFGITVERLSIEKNTKKKTTAAKQTVKNETTTKQSNNTATAVKKEKNNSNTDNTATLAEIKQYLSKSDNPEEVLKIFNQYKSKQAICNGMTKKFKDSKKAGAIYKKLKPLLKEKGKS